MSGNLVLAWTDSYLGLTIGVLLWGAHMALTQGIFSRMIADTAPDDLRATSFGAFWFVTGIASLLAVATERAQRRIRLRLIAAGTKCAQAFDLLAL